MGFKATLAHNQEDIDQTASAAVESFGIIKTGLDNGTLDELLLADLKTEPFRRLVR